MDSIQSNYFQKQLPGLSAKSIEAVIEMVGEGATVPFMARYRKEKTGNLDEVQIRAVIDTHETFQEILKRKTFLVKEISDQGNMTAEIKKRIETSWDLGELEEIYRPFKKKKKTKATIAREAGLEPLAQWIWDVGHGAADGGVVMEVKAKDFLNIPAGIASYELALKGAQDIVVEKIANEPELRTKVLNNYLSQGKVVSQRTKNFKPNSKYEMYADYSESVKTLNDAKASHRYLAMRRGWQEEELSLEIKGDDEILLKDFERFATTVTETPQGLFLKQSAKLAMSVYVVPSVTNEIHRILKDRADEDAIRVFTENVRKVLLASPFGPRVVLAVDPGLKTGCKVALVDRGGSYLTHTVMHILGEGAEEKAKKLLGEALKQLKVDAIAVGNGTAGRQTEIFLRKILKEIDQNIPVIMVNESGASVYSASEIARQEFPSLDVTVRGAISIARRLQDPLSELVKIDPKSIGVGQYQHDVNQSALKKGLEAVVESCVNAVGVDVNTASVSLLSYVSGIGPVLAQNIVDHRKKQLFSDRGELNSVPRFSPKVFEQAAGFLRVPNSKVFLDSTGIHPERYSAVRDMAKELGVSISDLQGEGAKKILQLREKWQKIIGEFTFQDIVKELEKPGRDPRDPFKAFHFREDIFEVKDLKEEMICPGLVTNVTNFGAFVDIGVHQDGLVHISELSHNFVSDPRTVVNPGDAVTVRVLGVDLAKNQISLSMKLEKSEERKARPAQAPRAQGRGVEGGQGPAKAGRGERQRSGGPGPDQRGGGPRPGAPRPPNDARAGGPRPNDARGGGPRPNDSRGPNGPRPGSKPFNNPFAALNQLTTKK